MASCELLSVANGTRVLKTTMMCLGMACILAGCDTAPPEQTHAPIVTPPLSETVKQPLEDARNVEKQIFESADQQKRQAEQI